MAHKLIHISTRRAAPAKTVAQIVNNAAEVFFSSRLINNPHNRRNNQLMKRILCTIKRSQIHIIRKVLSRDIINIRPANAPLIFIEDVARVCGRKICLCGEEGVVPVPVGVESDPAAELGA
jgi:hypothetical protein